MQFLDVWKNPGAGEPYRIYGIPTQNLLYASGREPPRATEEGFHSQSV